ncbi:hypothetical protein ACSBIB_004681 [Escherichia coli]
MEDVLQSRVDERLTAAAQGAGVGAVNIKEQDRAVHRTGLTTQSVTGIRHDAIGLTLAARILGFIFRLVDMHRGDFFRIFYKFEKLIGRHLEVFRPGFFAFFSGFCYSEFNQAHCRGLT